MALTDGAVAALARQAADLFAPDASVTVEPPVNDDPYRWSVEPSGPDRHPGEGRQVMCRGYPSHSKTVALASVAFFKG